MAKHESVTVATIDGAVNNKQVFKRDSSLALPSYSIKSKVEGESFFIETLSEMVSKQQLKKDGITPDTDELGVEKWLHTCMVIDLQTGQTGDMVLPYIVKKAFDVAAKAGGLTGKRFELVKGKKVNRTNEWAVYALA